MKILSAQNLKIAAVVFGLVAIAFAFRPGKVTQTTARTFDFEPIRIQSPSEARPPEVSISPLPDTLAVGAGLMVPQGSYPDSNHSGFGYELAEEVELPADSETLPSNAPAFAVPAPATQPTLVESGAQLATELAKPAVAPADDFELVLDQNEPANVGVEMGFELDIDETPTAQPAEFVRPIGDAQAVEFVQPIDESDFAHVTVVAPLNDAAAQKAVHHIEYGKSLARRNATEVAGQEFFSALRVLAEANDTAIGGNQHTKALRNGLLAVREATDFKTDDPQRQLVIDVAGVIEGHQSRILGADEARNVTASTAMRRYFDYAGQQLGRCGGQNAVAAEALFCLGKMRSIASQGNPDPESLDTYEAIIFHHASLAADPSNFRSANELGVLLAKNGHLAAAEAYLKNSLRLNAIPQTWANLAKVHLRKGSAQDQQLANLAVQEYQVALAQPLQSTTQGLIHWVEPNEFIALSPAVMHNSPQSATASVAAPVNAVVPASSVQPESSPSFVQRIGSLLLPKNNNQ